MTIDEISAINSFLPTVASREVTPLSLATTPFSRVLTPVPLAVAALQALTPAQQTALLVNETLQSFDFVPSYPTESFFSLETNSHVPTVIESKGLSPVQRAVLTVNKTLHPRQATFPEVPQDDIPATEAEARNVNPRPVPQAATVNPLPWSSEATALTASGVKQTASASTPLPATALAADLTAPGTDRSFIQQTTAQATLDRNPIATAVYEIRDPKPAPPEPKPIRKEIHPPMAIGMVRPVDRLGLKRQWEMRKENGRHEATLSRPPLEERAIREMINRVNEDLLANGLPLHLVLAKNSEGYCLDIYDCSDDTACRLTQEVHLDLNEMVTILDNLQHETGIIININT